MNSELVYSYGCTPEDAAFQFDYSLSKARNAKNSGFHLVQSFAPGEVDEELAHQMGKELAGKLLESKYSYVIATHNDRGHIHNHIVFCAVNNIDYRRYHDCRESYRHIQKINDEINVAHNLSVIIPDPDKPRKSHSYAEWKHTKDGTSWKAKLKKNIKECLEFCSTYDDFLNRMKERGYEIKNADPADGKYISFKAPGQEKWIRGRATTLGDEFTRDSIIEKINNYSHDKNTKTAAKIIRNINNNSSGKVLDTIDTNSPEFQQSAGLKVWANRENFRRFAHNYTLLHSNGFQNTSELNDKLTSLQKRSDDCRYNAISLDHEIEKLSSSIKAMEQYLEFKPYHQKYRAARNMEAVFQKYEYELTLFDGARRTLKDDGVILRNVTPEAVEKAKEKYHQLLREKNNHLDEAAKLDKKIKELQKLNEEIQKNFEFSQDQERDEKQKKKEKHL